MYTTENDPQMAELAELLKQIQEYTKEPVVLAYVDAVKSAEKIKEKLKARLKQGDEIGEINGYAFSAIPTLGYTPEILIAVLGDRANEYIVTTMEVDKNKVEADIKEGILPKELQEKRVAVDSRVYFKEVKQEVQDTFTI